jgi:hypothetical protein
MCSLATVLGPGVESGTPLNGETAHDFCATERLCNTAAVVDQAIASQRPVLRTWAQERARTIHLCFLNTVEA